MNAVISNAPLAIACAVFICLASGILIMYSIARQRALKQEVLRKIALPDEAVFRDDQDFDVKPPTGLVQLTAKYMGFIGKRIAPENSLDYARMKRNFLRAGLRNPIAPAMFWGSKVLLLIALPLTGVLGDVFLKLQLTNQVELLICLSMAVFGYYLPDILLQNKIARRRDSIKKALPDMLDLMVVCVEAGLGLDATIRRIADEIKLAHKELSDELRLYGLELNAGMLREQALRNLASRINIEDVQNLVTVLIQTDQFGTSVAQALRVYSESFRTKRYLAAEEIAAKLPAKITFPVILFIFPSLFVTMAGPAVLRILEVFGKNG